MQVRPMRVIRVVTGREGGQDKTHQTETKAKRNACDPTKFSNLFCKI